jgi:protein TonB
VFFGILLSAISVLGQETTPSPVPRDEECKTVDQKAILIHRVDPEYPADLRKQKVQGNVVLEGIVKTDGSITDLRVLNSPSDTLSKLSTDAMLQWRYKPALCRGRPVRVYVTNTFTFRLGK